MHEASPQMVNFQDCFQRSSETFGGELPAS
jgi:hypothetical protein